MDAESFSLKHRELLELEKNSEIEETLSLHSEVPSKHLEKLGLCIRKLQASEKRSGLYGRTLIKFHPQWTGDELLPHKIFSGDIVGVGLPGDFGHKDVLMSGVVWGTSQTSVTVAFEQDVDAFSLDDHTFYCLIKLANNVTYRRLKNVLMDLQKYKGGPASNLIDVLFGACLPSSPIVSLPKSILSNEIIKFVNTSLNDSQKDAVKFALCQREIAIVHGPPGTGKTTTVVEIICQLVAQGLKLLVCAPSNVAVDNLVERLFAAGTKVIRLGHPARAMKINQDLSLDAALFSSDNSALVGDIRKEMDAILMKVGKTKDKGMKHKLRMESKQLSQELRQREVAAIKEVLKRADVIASTLTSCYTDGPLKHLPKEHFGCIIIDECSQAIEAACWIPLLRSSKCVIAGDHLQLPPTIISKAAARGGLAVTLMERLMKFSESDKFVKMLDTQYRMHESIMQWPSDKLYGGKLKAHPSVAAHLLKDLPNVENNEYTSTAIWLIDTTGCNMPELEVEDEASKGNEGEAKLVCHHVECLVKSGVSPADIAVVTPYNLQVHILRSLLAGSYPGLEIKSVDGFQGREKEAIVMSLVRSNPKREVGFLAEDRRINVAMTRARRHLAVVCDSETVSGHQFLKEFVEHLSEFGEVRSAHQYRDELSAITVEPLQKTSSRQLPKSKTKPTAPKQKANADTNSTQVPKQANCNMVSGNTAARSEEVEKATDRFSEILQKFIEDPLSNVHRFPPTLTAFERRVVHEICEGLGLAHVSQGENDGRQIVVTKKKVDKFVAKTNEVKSKNCKQNENSSSQPNMKPGTMEAAVSKKPQPTTNNEAAVTLEKNVSSQTDKTGAEKTKAVKKPQLSQKNILDAPVPPTTTTHQTKKQNGTKVKSNDFKSATLTDDDDVMLDRLLAATIKRDNTCQYPKCKTSTALLRQTCDFCRKGFCLSHGLPEIHGCGDAARAEARARIKKEGKIVPGSGKVSHELDPVRRVHLERKLEKKLGELAEQRSQKVTKKTK